MSAETAVYLAAASVGLMVLIVAAITVVVLAGVIAAWPKRRRQSPGVQYWACSVQTDTAPILIGGAR
jgi:hypothetical protein